ncbi:hypothetical protein [Chryseobacterium carnipullorum]|uniref:Uncharacterized protein n=1 Tax=Chryseobacterium carnipullorum TaxID=1124835 RepID=A0A376EDK4_CHRCU|nr:hypothetical protein [Chryseobacterium carnipullorum]STD07314.1 Uncharacterised protein [Chryseobacterium carnipullorum]
MLKKIFDFFRENGPVEEITVVPVTQESTLHFVENMNIPESSDIKPYLRKSSEAREKINNLEEHTETYKEYCLEKTSNQHTLKAPGYKIIEKTVVRKLSESMAMALFFTVNIKSFV